MRNLKVFMPLLMMAGLDSCDQPDSSTQVTETEAIEIAQAFEKEKFPQRSIELTPDVVNGGKSWVVTLRPPPDAAGSTPVVIVHKDTGDVVAEFGY